MADFNFNSKHRPGKFNDQDVLSRLPLDPSEYMGACKAEMEKDAIFSTIQAVIHQKENARQPEDQSCVSNFALFTSKIKKKIPSSLTNQRSAILSSMLLEHNMCDTKFSIYLYWVRLESVHDHVVTYPLGSFRGRCIKACVWYVFFSLGLLPALFHFVSLFMFLSFSLFQCLEFGHLIRN